VPAEKIEDRANRGGQIEQVGLAEGAIGERRLGTIDYSALDRPLQGARGIVSSQGSSEASAAQGECDGPSNQAAADDTDSFDLGRRFHPHLSTIGAS
jgi:hypothetical protein